MHFNLAAPLFRHARHDGSRLALSVAGIDLTYAELGSLAVRVARWLAAGEERAPGFVAITGRTLPPARPSRLRGEGAAGPRL